MLAGERVLGVGGVRIRSRGIENLSRRQRLGQGERVGRIQGVIAEVTEERGVDVVGPGFCHDVDGGAAGPAEVRPVIAAINLKFLHGILRHIQPDTARIIVHLAAIDGNAVAAAVAAIKGEAALGRLLDAIILVRGEPRGIGNRRRQQGEAQVIAAIDGQIADVLLIHHVGLPASFGFHHRRFRGDLNLLGDLRHLHGKIDGIGLADVHHHIFRDLRLEP